MAAGPARHRYCRCGTQLAADNPGRQCARCDRSCRDKLIAPPEVPAEFWQTGQFREAFAAQHMGQVARAYRTHPYHYAVYGPGGIPQQLLGQWLGLRQPQVSRYETGPPIRDLDTLTYWARTLRIPPEALWFRLPEDNGQQAIRRPAAIDLAPSGVNRSLEKAALTEGSGELAGSTVAAGSERGELPSLSSVVAVLGPSRTLGIVQDFTESVITRYELEGPRRLITEVGALRRLCQQLGSQVSGAAERAQLAKLSSQQAGLLAYMSVNLSHFARAERYALEAAMFATAINDAAFLAWIKGTQSFAAYYQQRYPEALMLAQIGVRMAQHDAQRIRLLSNGVARAAGKLGDRQAVDRAVGEAFELAEKQDSSVGMTPCVAFAPYGWVRTAANVATAYLSVGDYAKVLSLTRELDAVVATSESDWSRSLVSLDEATALTLGRQGDLDHAATVGMRALAASADKPIASVRKRATELAASLRRVGHQRAGNNFSAALREWSQNAQQATR